MRIVPCVGGLVYDDRGRLLLVLRAHDPARSTWSIPGGKVESGEDGAAAVVRELREETGLEVAPTRQVGVVERPAPDGGTFVIEDFACQVLGGVLRAGDDADDVRWFSAADLAATDPASLAPGLLDALAGWTALPL
jgi:ADP-ribose pyrophosphatase YjhB (NUDIX family)